MNIIIYTCMQHILLTGWFRAGRGCIDQVFAVRQEIEKVIEKDKVVYAAFVDLEKAHERSCGWLCKSMVQVESY